MRDSGLDIFELDIPLTPPPQVEFSPADPSTYIDLTTKFYDPFNDTPSEPAYVSNIIPWPPNLPLELALGGDPEETLQRFNVTEEEYAKWATMPAFRRALSEASKQVREQGLTFKVLCQGIALDFLPTLDQKLHDPSVPFAQRHAALKDVVRWGGLEPKDEKIAATTGNMVNIQINL